MSNHAEEIKQIIAEMREKAFECEQEDRSSGMFADPETADQLNDWADRLEKAVPFAPTDDELRAEFERQHKGRNLKQHGMRGTYIAANIAALWNQHKRTAEWLQNRGAAPSAQPSQGGNHG